jgi:hypothetical protein
MHGNQFVRHLLAMTCGCVIGSFCGTAISKAGASDSPAAAVQQDLWRRTPAGWELTNRWNGRATLAHAGTFSLRFDSHPAVLALAESLAVVAAFAAFPPRLAAKSR